MDHPNNQPIISVFIVEPAKEGRHDRVLNRVRDLQHIVGGYLQQVRCTSEGVHGQDGLVALMKEGTPRSQAINRVVAGVTIRGTFFFARLKDGDFVDLLDEDIEYIKVLLISARMVFA